MTGHVAKRSGGSDIFVFLFGAFFGVVLGIGLALIIGSLSAGESNPDRSTVCEEASAWYEREALFEYDSARAAQLRSKAREFREASIWGDTDCTGWEQYRPAPAEATT